jgi:aminoglycoside 2'-N-acetyltransferase I
VTRPAAEQLDLAVVESDALGDGVRDALRALWDRAFGDRFDDHDAEHAYGGVHVLGYLDGSVVTHASAVPRRIRLGSEWQTIGYVEAVATDPAHQGAGLGRATMLRLHEELAIRWPAAMLSTGQATGFYERLGWERWQGTSYTQTATGVVPDGEHGGLIVLRVQPSAEPDLTQDVTCEDRPGDAW